MQGTDTIISAMCLNGSEVCRKLANFLCEGEHKEDRQGMVVAVVGAAGELVAFGSHSRAYSLPQTLAQRKAWTACRFRRSTQQLEQEIREGTLELSIFNDDQLIAMSGGVPIVANGVVIGAVGISGLPPEQDAALASEFASWLQG